MSFKTMADIEDSVERAIQASINSDECEVHQIMGETFKGDGGHSEDWQTWRSMFEVGLGQRKARMKQDAPSVANAKHAESIKKG